MNAPIPKSGLYKGSVYHERHLPKRHAFSYSVFMLWLRVQDLDDLSKKHSSFGYNRFAPLSVYDKDHGRRDGQSLQNWLKECLCQCEITYERSDIYMLTFPRQWGYVFNPLTNYYVFDRESRALKAMIYQVRNTFGESHSYICPVTETQHKAGGFIEQHCDKGFYVSPFMEVSGHYHFRFRLPADTLDFAIHQFFEDGQKALTALWTGDYLDLNNRNLLVAALKQPFMSLSVMVGIHMEALRLWRKGIKLTKKPDPPQTDTTYIKSFSSKTINNRF